MKTYILLFRGINVGGRHLLPMKELVSLLDKSKYHNARTYIQSGNLVLRSQEKPGNIASLIGEKFGFEPEIIVLEESEFRTAAEMNPYKKAEGKYVHLFFCKDRPRLNVEKMERLKSMSEEYHVDGNVCYFYAPEGIGRSKLAASLESCLGVPSTGRNLNTVNKLLQIAEDTGAGKNVSN